VEIVRPCTAQSRSRKLCNGKSRSGRYGLRFFGHSPALQPHDERNSDKLNYVTVIKNVRMRKGKWQRFSTDQEQRILHEKKDAPEPLR
jgi:hypothetical protein